MPRHNDVIEGDGVGLAALINTGAQLHEMIEERRIAVGVVYLDGDDVATTCLMAVRDVEKPRTGALVVTVERNPRVIRLGVSDG